MDDDLLLRLAKLSHHLLDIAQMNYFFMDFNPDSFAQINPLSRLIQSQNPIVMEPLAAIENCMRNWNEEYPPMQLFRVGLVLYSVELCLQ